MTVTAPDSDGYCTVSADAINDAVEEFNITIVSRLRFTDDTTEIRQQTFENMKVTTRSKSSEHLYSCLLFNFQVYPRQSCCVYIFHIITFVLRGIISIVAHESWL